MAWAVVGSGDRSETWAVVGSGVAELQKHEDELWRSPQDWMPWNYQATLDALAQAASEQL